MDLASVGLKRPIRCQKPELLLLSVRVQTTLRYTRNTRHESVGFTPEDLNPSPKIKSVAKTPILANALCIKEGYLHV